MGIKRDKLEDWLKRLLNPEAFSDYGPNGLQVEGAEVVQKVAFAVSATIESASKAIKGGADTLIVHHGLFWSFHGPKALRGPFARRVFPLVRHNVNLFAYHLPLDAHPVVGNAASIARKLEMSRLIPFGGTDRGPPPGVCGRLKVPLSPGKLQSKLEALLNHAVPAAIPDGVPHVSSLGIITGGAGGEWKHCLAAAVDAYLTGEMSEHHWHEAREAGVCLFAGGHHATERFGPVSLQGAFEREFSLPAFFIDSDNPA